MTTQLNLDTVQTSAALNSRSFTGSAHDATPSLAEPVVTRARVARKLHSEPAARKATQKLALAMALGLFTVPAWADPMCDLFRVASVPSGVCLFDQASSSCAAAASSSCPATGATTEGSDCEMAVFDNPVVTRSTVGVGATAEIYAQLGNGMLVDINLNGIATYAGSGIRELKVARFSAVDAGNTEVWSLNAHVIEDSGDRFLSLELENSQGGSVLAVDKFNNTGFRMRIARTSSPAAFTACLADAAGNCATTPTSVSLASTTSMLLFDAGLLQSAPAASSCEQVTFKIATAP